MRDDSAEILFQFLFSARGHPHFDVVRPAFPLPAASSPIVQGALKGGFGEPVVACDMLEPFEFPPLVRCQSRIMWAYAQGN